MGTHVNLLAVSGPEVETAFREFMVKKGREIGESGICLQCHLLWESEPEEVMRRLPTGLWVVYAYCFELRGSHAMNADYTESRGPGAEPLRKWVRYQAGNGWNGRQAVDAIMDLDEKGKIVPGTIKKFPSMCRD